MTVSIYHLFKPELQSTVSYKDTVKKKKKAHTVAHKHTGQSGVVPCFSWSSMDNTWGGAVLSVHWDIRVHVIE